MALNNKALILVLALLCTGGLRAGAQVENNACAGVYACKDTLRHADSRCLFLEKTDSLLTAIADSLIRSESFLPVEDSRQAQSSWKGGLYLSNNLVMDALLVANLGFEADLSEHFSIAFPICYSGWNYFSEYTKVRCLGIRPELRWWPFRSHWLYLGAHGAVSYFNVAYKHLGDYRYQDTDGRRPLYGGGLDLGGSIRLNDRLSILLSAGAGVYSLDYDMFYLGPNGRQAYAARKQTWFGPDFLQISLVYRFNRLDNKKSNSNEK